MSTLDKAWSAPQSERASDRLVTQELAEANGWLAAFDDARGRASFYLGNGALMAVIACAAWFLSMWLGFSFRQLAMLAAILSLGLLCLGVWWRRRSRRALREVTWRCAKLERAGLSLRWTAAGVLPRQLAIGANDEHAIEFGRLTCEQFSALSDAL